MKNSIFYLGFIICVIATMVSCSDMMDIHESYLGEGERIYIGKVDSLKFFPGENRTKIRFWTSDPRCKKVGFYWTPAKDSMIVNLSKSETIDSFEVYLGDESEAKKFIEGSYTLKAVTYDDTGNSSIPVESIFNIYGDRYRSLLSNRILSDLEYEDKGGVLSLYFADPINEEDNGIQISYTDKDGEIKRITIEDSELTSPVKLDNVDVHEKVLYRTMYFPEPKVIDTFWTDFIPIEITQIHNVALNKPVLWSDSYNSNYVGTHAVDGDINSSNSRWFSSREPVEHWLEIDLEQEYNIVGFKTYTGASGEYNYPTPEFIFQAEIAGEWIDIVEVSGNSNAQFEREFPEEIVTSKVRYYVPPYENNTVRLYEIEVYAIIKY